MLAQEFLFNHVDDIVNFVSPLHLPVMIAAFVGGVGTRLLVYFTVQRQEWFSYEFEKRVNRFLDEQGRSAVQDVSFSFTAKRLLEKTFYEIFEYRSKLRRRRNDRVLDFADRIFLIRLGAAWLVHDILRQIRYLKWSNQTPQILNVTKNTLSKNPSFSNLFGILPIGGLNELLNILPGLFVIGGIFGTFLGVMRGLPKLGGMDISNVDATKLVMDTFLHDISFSMSASLAGIFFSIVMTLINSIFNPERLFADVVDRLEHSLDLLWNRADNNVWPTELPDFNENRDPTEALAEQSVAIEIYQTKRSRHMEHVEKNQAAS